MPGSVVKKRELIDFDRLSAVGAVSVVNFGSNEGLLEGLEDIGLEVLAVFDSAAETDQVVEDTGDLTLFLGDAGVGHGAGDLDERLDTAEGLGKDEELGGLAEAFGGFAASLDAEAEHATAHSVAVLLEGDLAVWVGVDAGVVDSLDVRGGLEGTGNQGCVCGGLSGTEMEGLETAVGQPAVKGRGDGTNGVLEEGQSGLDLVGVESGNTHEDVLEHTKSA